MDILIDIRKISVGESLNISESFSPSQDYFINFQANLTNKSTEKNFILTGTASCIFTTNCSLCLKQLEISFNLLLNECFVEGNPVNDNDVIIINNAIDIHNAVFNNLLQHIPMKPLCSDNCLGLCPKCGADLNIINCNCKSDINSAFTEVISFFNNNEEV